MKIHKNARLMPKGREILVYRIVNEGRCGEHLPRWLHQYNWHRPQPRASLKHRTPIQFLNIPLNNVVGLHR